MHELFSRRVPGLIIVAVVRKLHFGVLFTGVGRLDVHSLLSRHVCGCPIVVELLCMPGRLHPSGIWRSHVCWLCGRYLSRLVRGHFVGGLPPMWCGPIFGGYWRQCVFYLSRRPLRAFVGSDRMRGVSGWYISGRSRCIELPAVCVRYVFNSRLRFVQRLCTWNIPIRGRRLVLWCLFRRLLWS